MSRKSTVVDNKAVVDIRKSEGREKRPRCFDSGQCRPIALVDLSDFFLGMAISPTTNVRLPATDGAFEERTHRRVVIDPDKGAKALIGVVAAISDERFDSQVHNVVPLRRSLLRVGQQSSRPPTNLCRKSSRSVPNRV